MYAIRSYYGLIRAVRKKGYERVILGGPQMGAGTFLKNAGAAADGVVFPLLYMSGTKPNDFEHRLACLCEDRPDFV